MNKYLIAGLGNIGEEYANTRHNVGFLIADELVASFNLKEDGKSSAGLFTTDRYAAVNTSKFRGRQIITIKPSTYMNLSGKAIRYWMQQENISKENVLIVSDELALPFGTLRMRKKGSDGGHNGLASIIQELHSTELPRLRFGIGNEFLKGKQVDYVLGTWSEEERKILAERVKTSVEMVKTFIIAGIDKAMNDYNK
jgi:PTH1 family peptidyl-tRNA hydrolase